MTANVGTADRILRLILGAFLILLPLTTSFAAGTPWLWWGAVLVGLVLVVTAAIRVCPAYWLFGVRTCARS